MPSAVYSELDHYCCEWLSNLQGQGLIAKGLVARGDFRALPLEAWSNEHRTHFFAGIGIWDLALQMAAWPENLPVWTGSCPCQPFSSAGRGKGFDDERHLWPAWFEIIRECRPPIIFGEQVASPAGRAWFDLVSSDLEDAGYAVGSANLCAGGVGAPHIRQRLYWVAIAGGERRERLGLHLREWQSRAAKPQAARRAAPSILGNASGTGGGRDSGAVPCSQGTSEGQGLETWRVADEPQFAGSIDLLANTDDGDRRQYRSLSEADGFKVVPQESRENQTDQLGHGGAVNGFWHDAEWLYCRDGKYRPTKPGVFPLAHGYPARVAKLRAIGNAIVPQAAATFISIVMEALQ